MLEERIKKILKEKSLLPKDVYTPLKINRINFYKAIKTSNMGNKSLQKILSFLGYSVTVTLNETTKKCKED